MDYAKPADVLASMVDAGVNKLALPLRDFLIRGAPAQPSAAPLSVAMQALAE
jgi:hypothetical protein